MQITSKTSLPFISIICDFFTSSFVVLLFFRFRNLELDIQNDTNPKRSTRNSMLPRVCSCLNSLIFSVHVFVLCGTANFKGKEKNYRTQNRGSMISAIHISKTISLIKQILRHHQNNRKKIIIKFFQGKEKLQSTKQKIPDFDYPY